ncbi:splicing factor YJU2-like [Argonauta hians]
MSERKVLNKYYPPDFDPSKIPKLRLPRNRQYSIRIMAPFNMRCNTCGEYVYKGKKFNSRKETVENEDYLGLKIFRFYIKCPRCVSEIAFKTDLKNTDYTLEAGATRNFEAAKLAEQMEERSRKEKEEEEMNNPMKVLENRTKASRQEMEQIDALEELRDLNNRHATVDHETMLKLHAAYEEQLAKLQEEEDENLVKSIFNTQDSDYIKRLDDDDEEEDNGVPSGSCVPTKNQQFGDLLTEHIKEEAVVQKKRAWDQSVGLLSTKSSLSSLVKKKKSPEMDSEGPSRSCEKTSTVTKIKCETEVSSKKREDCDKTQESKDISKDITVKVEPKVSMPVSSSALSLLGSYSDSDSDT